MDRRQQEQRSRIDLLYIVSDGYKRSINKTSNIFGNVFNDTLIFILIKLRGITFEILEILEMR